MPALEISGNLERIELHGFSARRLNIKYSQARSMGRSSRFSLRTLNATACAVPRMIICILENFQTATGRVTAEALRLSLGGMEVFKVIY